MWGRLNLEKLLQAILVLQPTARRGHEAREQRLVVSWVVLISFRITRWTQPPQRVRAFLRSRPRCRGVIRQSPLFRYLFSIDAGRRRFAQTNSNGISYYLYRADSLQPSRVSPLWLSEAFADGHNSAAYLLFSLQWHVRW
jgi:hypothetical protein